MVIKEICIYKIQNLINDKFYIGSTKDFTLRKSAHLTTLRNNKHHNIFLQRAWNKYGEENFRFEKIECTFKEVLLEREQHYLDTLKPEYNICLTAGSPLGCKHSPEANLAKSMRHKGKSILPEAKRLEMKESRRGIGNPNFGNKITEENREKSRKANLGKKRTQAHKDLLAKLMSEKRKGQPSHNKGKKRIVDKETGQITYLLQEGKSNQSSADKFGDWFTEVEK